ncbi:MAG: 7-carboxy-7-deazaguanine synthase QueE [Thermoplasmata archaeon]
MKINEIFYSIQGEGIHIGIPMVFVRFTGCNLRCEWCDTKYAFFEGSQMNVEEVMTEIKKYKARWVCITGGEPLLQEDVYALIYQLLKEEYNILIQTNGSISLIDVPCEDTIFINMDIKTPSSKMQDKLLDSNLEILGKKDSIKFVIADEEDYKYMRRFLKEHEIESEVILQPEGNKNYKELVEKVLKDRLNVRVLPQLHKLIWGEKHGV